MIQYLVVVCIVACVSGCASSPWVCTPSTCVSVASEDLPDEIRGSWAAGDGTRLVVQDYYLGTVGGNVAPKAATAVVISNTSTRRDLHITSFDGYVVVGEEYLGAGAGKPTKSPRRFSRILVDSDRIRVSSLDLEMMVQAYEGDDLRLIQYEGEDAVVYQDIQGVAALMVEILGRDEVWGSELVFAKDVD